MPTRFSKAVSAKLGFYVYCCIDPRNGEPFYIGKGRKNRCFSHSKDKKSESRKVARIKEIRTAGMEPKVEILAHGLDEETAWKVEAAVIDVLGKQNLTNEVRGYHARSHGRMTVEQVTALYRGKRATIVHPVLLIRINRLYRHTMSPKELYEATRGFWRVRPGRKPAQYALAVYEGVVREVYKIDKWFKAGTTPSTRSDADRHRPGRFEFVGKVANDKIRKLYLHTDVSAEFKPGSQNPVKYVMPTVR